MKRFFYNLYATSNNFYAIKDSLKFCRFIDYLLRSCQLSYVMHKCGKVYLLNLLDAEVLIFVGCLIFVYRLGNHYAQFYHALNMSCGIWRFFTDGKNNAL